MAPNWLVRSHILYPMMSGVKGTIMAAKMAMEIGWSINLSGGYHHASSSRGMGYCIYPDISLAVYWTREFYDVQRIMIIDLDAHQGNGYERDFMYDANVFTCDMYNADIFPGDAYAMQGIDQ